MEDMWWMRRRAVRDVGAVHGLEGGEGVPLFRMVELKGKVAVVWVGFGEVCRGSRMFRIPRNRWYIERAAAAAREKHPRARCMSVETSPGVALDFG